MLPPFSSSGDLPAGIHAANWNEFETRFAKGSETRVRAFERLRHLRELVDRTGCLARFLVFGSLVSSTSDPADIDLALVMTADFKLEVAPRESRTVFSHAEAQARFGASVFWARQGMLPENLMREFLDAWQTKRDGTKRGIVEIKP